MLLLPHVVWVGVTSCYVAVCKNLAVDGKMRNSSQAIRRCSVHLETLRMAVFFCVVKSSLLVCLVESAVSMQVP